MNLCSEVLKTALDVVNSLPVLSLANENQISTLGSETLMQVCQFLSATADPSSGATKAGMNCSCFQSIYFSRMLTACTF